MKTIKYLSIILFFGLAYVMTDCKKEDSKDISVVTTPPIITLKGDAQVFLVPGQQYVDSGVVVTGGTLVNTINLVINTVPGSYSVKYIAKNSDGALVTAVRKVTVIQLGDGSLDLSGTYTGGRGTSVGGDVTITKVATGVFLVSDFYGEFYEIFRGYGPQYRAPGLLTYIGNNKAIMPVNTTSAFGDFNFKGGSASIGTNSSGKLNIQYQIEFTDGTSIASPFFLTKQ